MVKYKVLSLLETISLKKDILWGKKYFAELENNCIKSLLIYSNLYNKLSLKEIYSLENPSKNILDAFLNYALRKKSSRYLVYELDEKEQIDEVELAHSLGFKRYNRNYFYNYDNSRICETSCPAPSVFCRPAELSDLKSLEEIDIASQLLEYRDQLYRTKKFFREIILNTWVFTTVQDHSKVIAFCTAKDFRSSGCFEFVAPASLSQMMIDLVDSFGEQYINFEKNLNFKFSISESHKSILGSFNKDFQLFSSSQLLIYEGIKKSKIKEPMKMKSWFRILVSPKAKQSFQPHDQNPNF